MKATQWLMMFAIVTAAATARAEVRLSPMFSSHMVLQRDLAAPIWGTAAPGEKVTVKFRDQQKETAADAKGNWMVKLDPLKAGGPDTLTVSAVTLDDVLVGEVWVGSGQSNMEVPVRGESGGPDALLMSIASEAHPRLRFKLRTGWAVATPEANRAYGSALLFAFGLRLQQELDVPVGLMVGSVGGSPSCFWISEEAFQSDGACREAVAKAMTVYDEAAERRAYAEALAAWDKAVEKGKAEAAQARQVSLPALPIPPVKPGELGKLYRQPGSRIGMHYEERIKPFVPYGIRGVLWDQGEALTGIEGVDQCTLMGALIRSWRKDWGQGDFPFIYVLKPSGRGCAWDYADPVTRLADKFAPLPPAPLADPSKDLEVQRRMIKDNWNEYWNEFVLGWIQLHKLEVHIRMMQHPNTAMVICSDLGGGIHPLNKFGYGARAARVALGAVYGRPVEIYGPIYQSHAVEGGKIRIRFTHVGQGLAWRHGEKLQGFAVAGADRVFHWADAAIEGDAVVVSSAKVPAPVAARYAWAAERPWANLFNKDGLPAVPFRTDTWNSMYWCAPFGSTAWIIPGKETP